MSEFIYVEVNRTKRRFYRSVLNLKYGISKSGLVCNWSRRRLLKLTNHLGYARIVLNDLGNIKSVLVHRMVAEQFIPRMLGKDQVNHKDFNKQNNAVSNLEWVTGAENAAHYWSSLLVENQRHLLGNESQGA